MYSKIAIIALYVVSVFARPDGSPICTIDSSLESQMKGGMSGGNQKLGYSIAFDKTSVAPGDKVTVTINKGSSKASDVAGLLLYADLGGKKSGSFADPGQNSGFKLMDQALCSGADVAVSHSNDKGKSASFVWTAKEAGSITFKAIVALAQDKWGTVDSSPITVSASGSGGSSTPTPTSPTPSTTPTPPTPPIPAPTPIQPDYKTPSGGNNSIIPSYLFNNTIPSNNTTPNNSTDDWEEELAELLEEIAQLLEKKKDCNCGGGDKDDTPSAPDAPPAPAPDSTTPSGNSNSPSGNGNTPSDNTPSPTGQTLKCRRKQ